MKHFQFVLTSQAKYIQPELRKQRDKIEANVVEKWMINGRRMPELASHLAISGAFQVRRRLLLCFVFFFSLLFPWPLQTQKTEKRLGEVLEATLCTCSTMQRVLLVHFENRKHTILSVSGLFPYWGIFWSQ